MSLSSFVFGLFLSVYVWKTSDAKDIVVAIGVDNFTKDWTHLDELKHPKNDVHKILNHFSSMGYSTKSVINPKASHVTNIFKNIHEEYRDRDDTIIIYISTHGENFIEEKNGSRSINKRFLVSDTTIKDLDSTSLNFKNIENFFNALPSQRKVLILAACKSGDGKMLRKGYGGVSKNLTFAVLSGSSVNDYSYEDPDIGDVYTHFLIEAFQNPKNGDDTIIESHIIAARNTEIFTKGAQKPEMRAVTVGVPLIFSNKRAFDDDSIVTCTSPEEDTNAYTLDGVRVNKVTRIKVKGGTVKKLEVHNKDGEKIYVKDVYIKRKSFYDLKSIEGNKKNNSLFVLTNSYKIKNFFPEKITGFGLQYNYKQHEWSRIIKVLYYDNKSSDKYSNHNYNFTRKMLQIGGGLSYSKLLTMSRNYSLHFEPSANLTSYYLRVTPDKNYFQGDDSGFLLSPEMESKLVFRISDYFNCYISYALSYHTNFSQISQIGYSFSAGVRLLSW